MKKSPKGFKRKSVVKENWEKWDFSSQDSFVGKYTGETQVLEKAGVADESGNKGDIELLGFDDQNAERYGIINSGALKDIQFQKGVWYEIIFTGKKKMSSGRQVNLFDVYELESVEK